MSIKLGPINGLGGCYLTAETGVDNANGTGNVKWQLRDAAGRALARQATVTAWYMVGSATMTPHTAAANFQANDTDLQKKSVDVNQEIIVQTDTDGVLEINIDDDTNGAVYAYAHLGNGNGAIATVTVTGHV